MTAPPRVCPVPGRARCARRVPPSTRPARLAPGVRRDFCSLCATQLRPIQHARRAQAAPQALGSGPGPCSPLALGGPARRLRALTSPQQAGLTPEGAMRATRLLALLAFAAAASTLAVAQGP